MKLFLFVQALSPKGCNTIAPNFLPKTPLIRIVNQRVGVLGQKLQVRPFAHPAQIQPISIPAGLNGGIGMQATVTVKAHGVREPIKLSGFLSSPPLSTISLQLSEHAIKTWCFDQ